MRHPDDHEFTDAYEPDDEAGESFVQTLEAERTPGRRA
jgi:hypothetical protein